jgi:hypothetical protein
MVMDLRDPWSFSERIPEVHASPLFFRLASRFERRAVKQASLVVMNTEPARRAMQAAHPDRSGDVITVPNAYDERAVPVVDRGRRFVIAYAGTIYLDRTPHTLFKAVSSFVREQGLSPDQIGIEFMGHINAIDGETVEQIAQREGLGGYVATHPPGGFADAERFLAGGSMLVSLPQDSHMAIPSKIYDCMRFDARLLVFAEPESATAEYLAGSGADVVAPNDVEATIATLRSAWSQHEAGLRPEPIARNPAYSRRAAADRMFEALDRVLAGEGQPADR